MSANTPLLKLVVAGHVDHGKSTLIARLLHDLGALPEGKAEQVKALCERRGVPFEWAFALDSLQVERDQGITVDTSMLWFSTPARRYALIDAPGHKEFLKNLVTGASQADAALLVVDAREGMREQSRRHAYLLHMLGIRQLAVAINKMDAAEYSEAHFHNIARECGIYLESIGLNPSAVIPVSAREGDNLAARSARMGWYKGPTVVEALEAFQPPAPLTGRPFRLPVQDVYKHGEHRVIVGRVESGKLSVGDEILVSPTGARARIATIESWPESTMREAIAGQSIGLTLDEPLFVERGHVLSHVSAPPVYSSMMRARIFWLGRAPLVLERRYRLHLHTVEIIAELRAIDAVIQPDTLKKSISSEVPRGAVAEVMFRVRGMLPLDAFAEFPAMGRFVIMEEHAAAGGGIVDLEGIRDQRVSQLPAKSHNITPQAQTVALQQRALANGHLPGILWFTGLSGSGKSTLAQGLQKQLFARGCQVFVLDGDNMRRGLSRDLGFSPEERRENLRRAGEVAAMFAEAGFIVITSFISPTHADRALARASAPEHFHSVYVKANLDICEQRDAKGLYKLARAGRIPEFTGISAPYEEPLNPDLLIDTAHSDVDSCVRQLLRYVERQFIAPVVPLGRGEAEDFVGMGI